jgi:hypothetical protein
VVTNLWAEVNGDAKAFRRKAGAVVLRTARESIFEIRAERGESEREGEDGRGEESRSDKILPRCL